MSTLFATSNVTITPFAGNPNTAPRGHDGDVFNGKTQQQQTLDQSKVGSTGTKTDLSKVSGRG